MQYNLLIFNKCQVGMVSETALIDAIKESNFYTLCHQYGLPGEMVKPALMHLKVVIAHNVVSSFFVLRYGEAGQRPLVVNRWDAFTKPGNCFLQEGVNKVSLKAVKEHLLLTREIFALELDNSQLRDMGLVFSYEIARWGACCGKGIVRGLDGCWYRLNQYKAFIPLETPGD